MPADLGKYVKRLDKKKGKRPPWLDDVDARDMLEELGVEKLVMASMDEINFSCPFPGHDHGDMSPSAYMNNGAKVKRMNTVWKCHGCGRSGNAIHFVSEYQQVSRQRAARWLRERWAPGWRAPKGGSMAKEWELRRAERERERQDTLARGNIPTLPWEMYHDNFGVDWSLAYDDKWVRKTDWARYALSRGFTPAELEDMAFGYDSNSRRITIPVCDAEGNLVGVKGRAIDKGRKPKYLILGDTVRTQHRPWSYGFEPYLKSLVVYGLDRWGEQKRYVWDEGEINVESWRKMGIPAFATGSAQMSDEQALIVREMCDEVVIFLDLDTAGHNAIWGYENEDGEWVPGAVAKLEAHVRVLIAGAHRWDANEYLTRGYRNRAAKLVANAKPAVRLQAPAAML